MLVDVSDRVLMEDDEVAVGEVVFWGEGVWRIDPDAREESCGAEGGDCTPLAEMAMPGCHADQQDKRVHGKEIAREERSAEDGEGDPIGEEDCGDGFELRLWGLVAERPRRGE